MTAVIDIVNNLIFKAKENNEISDVKFQKGYKNDFSQSPVNGYIAIVKIEKIIQSVSFVGGYLDSQNKGDIYTVDLVLDVYSDNDIAGEELSSTVLKIHQAVIQADDKGIIDSFAISPIEFDSNIKAIYRKISYNLQLCLHKEE